MHLVARTEEDYETRHRDRLWAAAMNPSKGLLALLLRRFAFRPLEPTFERHSSGRESSQSPIDFVHGQHRCSPSQTAKDAPSAESAHRGCGTIALLTVGFEATGHLTARARRTFQPHRSTLCTTTVLHSVMSNNRESIHASSLITLLAYEIAFTLASVDVHISSSAIDSSHKRECEHCRACLAPSHGTNIALCERRPHRHTGALARAHGIDRLGGDRQSTRLCDASTLVGSTCNATLLAVCCRRNSAEMKLIRPSGRSCRLMIREQ